MGPLRNRKPKHAPKRAKNPDAQWSPDSNEASVQDKLGTESASPRSRGEDSHTDKSEGLTKRQLIIRYHQNSPQIRASEIAQKVKTSVGYVWNVLSDYRKRVSSKRWGSRRLYGGVRGACFYEDAVLPEWYEGLRAPVVNRRSGMKQVGFKGGGDPCSCQFHRNGRVIIFPHALGWQGWLVNELVGCGWGHEKAELLVNNCQFTVKVIEAGVKVPEGYLPKTLMLKTNWGFMLVKDDSPTKNTLEIKLSVPDLQRYLGLPEIKKDLQLLIQGGLTHSQLLRAVVALLLRQGANKKTQGSDAKRLGQEGTEG